MGAFGNHGWLVGKNSLGGRFSSGIGGWLNDITGQSASAKQQFKQQMALQHDAQNFSKWQMANAHQMEVKDLQNAGLNPILSANAGASAGVVEGGTTGGTPSVDPMAMAGNIVSMMNNTKQTNANIKKINADIDNEKKLTNAKIKNLNATSRNTDVNTRNASTKTIQNINDENLAKTWWGRNISPVLRDIFGGGGAATGAIAGAAVSQAATSAKKARTPKHNKIGF